MISKERLQELINQGATIYGVDYGRILMADIVEIKTKDMRYNDSHDNFQYLYKESGDCYLYEFYEENLFETKEDAEWHKEFGCIERTERLNITDWQKFKNRDENFGFTVEDYSYKCFTDGIEIELVEFWGQGGRSLFKAPLTKENYMLACRKCKEIFLGDKEQ